MTYALFTHKQTHAYITDTNVDREKTATQNTLTYKMKIRRLD